MDGRVQKVLLLMLSATQPGEIIAARNMLQKLLQDAGTDIHEFVGKTNGLSDAEMKKLYDAGYKDGLVAGESKQQVVTVNFHNLDGTPAWEAVAQYCLQHDDGLTENEQKFVRDMGVRATWQRAPTEKQERWLRSIFFKLGGKL
jgi:hypothetical protein